MKNLIIFPGAGSLASSWISWASMFPLYFRILIAEYPGRGLKIDRPFETNFLSLCRQYQSDLQPYLNEPCILIGYSLGGYLAYELAKHLELSQKIIVEHLFLAGVSDYSNYSMARLQVMSSMDIKSLKNYLIEKVFDEEDLKKTNDELLDAFIPILQKDVKMLSSYKFSAYKLQAHLNVYNGLLDTFCHYDQAPIAWNKHSKKVTYFTYNGKHYLNSEAKDLIKNHILTLS